MVSLDDVVVGETWVAPQVLWRGYLLGRRPWEPGEHKVVGESSRLEWDVALGPHSIGECSFA